MANLTPLSPEYLRRTTEALAETEKSLKKELGYSEHLQDKRRIDFLRKHIEKLNKMIVEGWEAPILC